MRPDHNSEPRNLGRSIAVRHRNQSKYSLSTVLMVEYGMHGRSATVPELRPWVVDAPPPQIPYPWQMRLEQMHRLQTGYSSSHLTLRSLCIH